MLNDGWVHIPSTFVESALDDFQMLITVYPHSAYSSPY